MLARNAPSRPRTGSPVRAPANRAKFKVGFGAIPGFVDRRSSGRSAPTAVTVTQRESSWPNHQQQRTDFEAYKGRAALAAAPGSSCLQESSLSPAAAVPFGSWKPDLQPCRPLGRLLNLCAEVMFNTAESFVAPSNKPCPFVSRLSTICGTSVEIDQANSDRWSIGSSC